jgi:DNA (cytosine-5)-methyltransferase 1
VKSCWNKTALGALILWVTATPKGKIFSMDSSLVISRPGKNMGAHSTLRRATGKKTFLEFFAGSGLVAEGMRGLFVPVWANDISAKKGAVYSANHGDKRFFMGSIADVRGGSLPPADLSWASFPCQDLSLAGATAGIHAKRSGLVWEWLRAMDEMPEPPSLLVAENVAGLISANGGSHYQVLHHALRDRGYRVGAVLLDASHWVPQSRPRVFVIAVKRDAAIPSELMNHGPCWLHPPALTRAAAGLPDWIWWWMPPPPERAIRLEDIIEWDAPQDESTASERNFAMIPDRHKKLLSLVRAAPGYKRTRHGKQVLELRFDGLAGCLRTPEGGSSRQVLVLRTGDRYSTRLITLREASRLMGAPDSYVLPGSYNDGYKAMGDAVAAPVARYLAQHLLHPLAEVL